MPIRAVLRRVRTPSIAALLVAVVAPSMAAASGPATSAERHDDPRSASRRRATTRPWGAVEDYYLKLLNCTRTGGWVKVDGSAPDTAPGTSARTWRRSAAT